tara:strand:+ start:571 stop:1221 length:651 start_codon:yes stop_codon:yes gene_type:complete
MYIPQFVISIDCNGPHSLREVPYSILLFEEQVQSAEEVLKLKANPAALEVAKLGGSQPHMTRGLETDIIMFLEKQKLLGAEQRPFTYSLTPGRYSVGIRNEFNSISPVERAISVEMSLLTPIKKKKKHNGDDDRDDMNRNDEKVDVHEENWYCEQLGHNKAWKQDVIVAEPGGTSGVLVMIEFLFPCCFFFFQMLFHSLLLSKMIFPSPYTCQIRI